MQLAPLSDVAKKNGLRTAPDIADLFFLDGLHPQIQKLLREVEKFYGTLSLPACVCRLLQEVIPY